MSGDIAIVGMSCLFPGSDGRDEFWQTIVEKRSQLGEPTPEWGADRHLSDGRIYTTKGGFLRDLYRFDPVALGVMPSSIDGSEPDQFLALRVAREALIDAGYLDNDDDRHERTGIILGHSTYLHRGNASVVQHGVVIDQTLELLHQLLPDLDEAAATTLRTALSDKLPAFNADTAPGLVPNVMTGRIANRLDLKGPNYTIDAACASSLLSVGAAIDELRAGRSDMMLAGGVNAAIPAEVYMVFSQLGALSRQGAVRTFDAETDGTLLGEGLGVLVMKRTADAVADGDRIYATLRGVGQSSDGKAFGLLAPRLEGEMLAFERAYNVSEVDPRSVGLIEAHGTGIPKGDETEITAIRSVLGERGEALPDCAIGSVKSLIGHCIPAAGAAGLIKAALALHYRVTPPTLCETVNPALGIDETPLYVNTETRPWIHGRETPRRASVNAFGFGGVNSHAILEEAPEGVEGHAPIWPHEIVVLADATRDGLLTRARALAEAIATERTGTATLGAIAAAAAHAAAGKGPERLALVADSLGDLAKKLDKAIERLADPDCTRIQTRNGTFFSAEPQSGKLAFIFPGEGAQYQGMLSDLLMARPEARDWFDFWDKLFDGTRDLRPSSIVFPPPTTLDEQQEAMLAEELFGIHVGSEAMFIATQAIRSVLDHVGLRPDVVAGHSNGENSALIAGGAVDAQDRDALGAHIHRLSAMVSGIAGEDVIETGSLITVGAVERARVREVAEKIGLHLALDNCVNQTVLYGDTRATEEAAKIFRAEGGLCSLLPFDRPYHTPLFRPIAEIIRKTLADVPMQAPEIPIYSCATTRTLPADPDDLRAVAVEQWCSTVRFTETIERMYEDGVRFFVEVGPGSNLTGFVEDILRGRDAVAVPLDNNRKSSLMTMLRGLGRVWTRGRDMDLTALFEGRDLAPVDPETWSGPPVPRMRVISNTLPYVTLDAETIDTVRAGLTPGIATPVAQPVAHTPALSPTEAPAMVGIVDADGYGARSFEFLHHIETHDAAETAALCHLDTRWPFLRDHVLYAREVSDLDPELHGLAVVPLAVSLEMLAEIAAQRTQRPIVVRIESVRTYQWIPVEEGRRTVTLWAGGVESDGITDRVHAQIRDGADVLLEAHVVFADAEEALAPSIAPLDGPNPPTWADDELYDTGMFHGPVFQSIAGVHGWTDQGMDAVLDDLPLEGFTTPGEHPGLLLNPVLLDAIGQMTAFWIAQGLSDSFSTFPSAIERIDVSGAWREDTGGTDLRARIVFEGAGSSRTLAGSFEAIAPDGAVLCRATGWRDVYFDVPPRLYHARFHAREGFYGDDVTALFGALPEDVDAVAWHVPAFPDGLLTVSDAVWTRILVHTLLSARERMVWAGLPNGRKRRTDWLMGRIAAKEAARQWIWRETGQLLLPADVEILPDDRGRPVVTTPVETGLLLPAVSIAHSAGQALAIASAPHISVGCDLEGAARVDLDALRTGGFEPAEAAVLTDVDPSALLAGWCAKEAAAKALGTGLEGRPRDFRVATINGSETMIETPAGQIPARTRKIGEFMAAIAYTHELVV